jgi:hypothetical protein
LALEQAPTGAVLHAVAEEGVAVRDIAELIGGHLKLPVTAVPVDEAADHFGWIGLIFALDVPASSTLTQQRFDWHPVQPALVTDLDKGHYFNNSNN